MLAIIIPYFKITFFEATLQSLAAQTCQDFKVYIGDDASPEDPSMLLEKYKGIFDFVYHRFETNLGGISLTQQWERCIALSKEEDWVMILGDDDVLGKNVVEEFQKKKDSITQEGINVVRFATQIIDEKGKISNIFAEGENKVFNAEAVKAITVANAGKIWKPATEDSNPVKTVFKLPLTMQFAGPSIKK